MCMHVRMCIYRSMNPSHHSLFSQPLLLLNLQVSAELLLYSQVTTKHGHDSRQPNMWNCCSLVWFIIVSYCPSETILMHQANLDLLQPKKNRASLSSKKVREIRSAMQYYFNNQQGYNSNRSYVGLYWLYWLRHHWLDLHSGLKITVFNR